ncbi:MAG: hypothetical protein ACLTLQ_06755 [[Clostridium] scindens]
MKILIVSDTHKSHKNLDKVLEIVKPIDMLISILEMWREKTTTSRRWQTVLRI